MYSREYLNYCEGPFIPFISVHDMILLSGYCPEPVTTINLNDKVFLT